MIDYALHRVLANGSTAPKVIKVWSLELGGGNTVQLTKRHSHLEGAEGSHHAGEHVIAGREEAAEAHVHHRSGIVGVEPLGHIVVHTLVAESRTEEDMGWQEGGPVGGVKLGRVVEQQHVAVGRERIGYR